jgi:Protein of unknown function (DUF1326)
MRIVLDRYQAGAEGRLVIGSGLLGLGEIIVDPARRVADAGGRWSVERRGWLMAWQLQGRYFENCSCDMVCPCTTSGLTLPADYERCRVVLVFHVDAGTVEDVDVSGLTVAVLADTPPRMADGNWRVGMFMDAAASQEQAEKLGAVFAGQLGGPTAMLAH